MSQIDNNALLICQLVNQSVGQFVSWSISQLVSLSVGQFVSLSVCQFFLISFFYDLEGELLQKFFGMCEFAKSTE